ncbi:MAG: hypothetical protein AAFQ76_15080, partial [Cyanobacteria bacterium J06626_26]
MQTSWVAGAGAFWFWPPVGAQHVVPPQVVSYPIWRPEPMFIDQPGAVASTAQPASDALKLPDSPPQETVRHLIFG